MSRRKKILLAIATIILFGFLWPQNLQMPVKGATRADYNANSFWFYPWGKSVTHKGVDIFAEQGRPVVSSTSGIVLYTGNLKIGGNVVLILGPKWRLHYYAHLRDIKTRSLAIKKRGSTIGTVGDTGNAKGKPPHLHYTIITPIPYPWLIDKDRQGWKKMFFLNPIDYLE